PLAPHLPALVAASIETNRSVRVERPQVNHVDEFGRLRAQVADERVRWVLEHPDLAGPPRDVVMTRLAVSDDWVTLLRRHLASGFWNRVNAPKEHVALGCHLLDRFHVRISSLR